MTTESTFTERPRVLTRLATDDSTKAVYVHDAAGETINAMLQHVEKIRQTYGPYDEYIKANTSLHHALGSLFRLGFARECHVCRDGDLSLVVQEGESFVFGIVFFRDRAYDGTDREGLAGEWSLHS